MSTSLRVGTWLRRLTLAVPFVPLAFIAEHALPPGIPTAEGCSGSFSAGDGWQNLRVESGSAFEGDDGVERIPVATDGFVVLGGQFDDAELDVDVSGVDVSVTDVAGASVAGALTFLRATSQGANSFHGKKVYLGWEAAAALEVGTRLTLAMRAEPAPRDPGDVLEEQVELEVVGPPSTLANLKPSFGTWVDFQRGVGGGVNCVVDFGSCGSGDTVAYVERELLFANWIRWQPPEVTGMVAWEALAEVDGPQGVSVAEEPSFVFSTQGEESAGLVVFPRDATEHCAVLVVRDLRSGNELRSERFCAEPEVGEYAMGDNGLDSCAEPPNEELLEQWCEAVGDEPEACQPAAAGASAGGAGSAEAGGGASGEPTPKKGRSSSGCQLGGGEGSGAIALFLAVLAAGCRRRNKAKTSYDARA